MGEKQKQSFSWSTLKSVYSVSETERAGEGQREREREREREYIPSRLYAVREREREREYIPSRLYAVITEPDVGPNPRNHEIMT